MTYSFRIEEPIGIRRNNYKIMRNAADDYSKEGCHIEHWATCFPWACQVQWQTWWRASSVKGCQYRIPTYTSACRSLSSRASFNAHACRFSSDKLVISKFWLWKIRLLNSNDKTFHQITRPLWCEDVSPGKIRKCYQNQIANLIISNSP